MEQVELKDKIRQIRVAIAMGKPVLYEGGRYKPIKLELTYHDAEWRYGVALVSIRQPLCVVHTGIENVKTEGVDLPPGGKDV